MCHDLHTKSGLMCDSVTWERVTDILKGGATCDTFGSSTDRPRCARYILEHRQVCDVISSAGSMERSAYGRRKYISRLVGETPFIRVSSLHFRANHILAAYLVPRWIKTRLLKRIRSIDRFSTHYTGSIDPSSAWIDAASGEVCDKRRASLDKRRRPVDEWSISLFLLLFYNLY